MVQTPSANDTFFGLDISEAKKAFVSFRRKISKRYLLIEFGIDSLTYGEAKVVKDQVYISKINRISLDTSAIERGTPTDTEAMASFLTQIIEEEQIWAHRVGITLPPQAALSKIINLPQNLTYEEAFEHVNNPSISGFQFPITIENTDFDITPIRFPLNKKKGKNQAYFLNSVPKKLIDNIVKTLEDAKLELHSLDIAYSSLERLAIEVIDKLEDNEVILLIELSLECSHFYILSLSGPIHVSTLAAIKSFDAKENYSGDQSIEEDTINSEDYLPISDLDLKILFSEVEKELEQFKNTCNLQIREIMLSGVNSSHPDISKFFKSRFSIETSILRSISSKYIGNIALSKPIVMQDLNRLIGVGLSMIQTEEKTINDINKSRNKNINEDSEKDFEIKKDNDNKYNNMNQSFSKEKQENIPDSNKKIIPFEEFLNTTNEGQINLINNSTTSNITFNNKSDLNIEAINNQDNLPGDANLQNNASSPSLEDNSSVNNIVDDKSDLMVNKKSTSNDDSLLDFDSKLENITSSPPLEDNSSVNNIVDDKSDSDQKIIEIKKDNDNEDDFNMPEN
tara:strand:+ start:5365 stop:7065 length:1701 start_codon:yes stop_codon:yes gene_type:complete